MNVEEQAKDYFTIEQIETIAVMIAKNKEQTVNEMSMFVNSVQKMQKEFKSLKEELKPMLTQVKDHSEKHLAQYKMVRSLIGYMRDVDTKIDAIREVFVDERPALAETIDTKWDTLRGLRLKTDQEPISVGDVVWVTYKAEVVDGEKKGTKFEEEDFPVRVGSNTIAFEDLLKGKFLNAEFTEEKSFPKDQYKELDYAGCRVRFDIKIVRVKTSLPGV